MQQLARAFVRPGDERRPARAPLPFAALSGSLAASRPKLRTERHTGLEFPAEFCSRGRDGCAQLEGVGVRAKRIAGLKNVNVYALGIYIDEAAALKALAPKHKAKPAAALAKDAALFAGALACVVQAACAHSPEQGL